MENIIVLLYIHKKINLILPHSVKVAPEFLVFLVLVRVQVGQQL